MQISKNMLDNRVILAPEGSITGANASQLDDRIRKELKTARGMVLDMAEVPYMSSAGFRTILATVKRLQIKGEKLIVSNVNENIRRLFAEMGMEDYVIFQK